MSKGSGKHLGRVLAFDVCGLLIAATALVSATQLAFAGVIVPPLEWREIDTTQEPPNGPVPLTWDSTRNVAVAWTSNCGPNPMAGTWEFDGDWSLVETSGEPAACETGYLAFDGCRDVAVQYGGAGGNDFPYDYDGSSWTFGAVGPCNREHHRMVGLPDRCTVFVFGGTVFCTGDPTDLAAEYDGSSWDFHLPDTRPAPRSKHAIAYDESRHVVVIFGGFDGTSRLGDTWEFSLDSLEWRQIFTLNSPTPRDQATMAYHPTYDLVVLFGGHDGGFTDDTWIYDGTTWLELPSSTNPPASAGFMTYDSKSDRLLLLKAAQTWEFVCETSSAEIGPDKLNFGRLLTGHISDTRRLVVRNSGCVPVQIETLSGLESPFALAESPTLPVTLQPGSQLTVGVTFGPTTEGYFRTTLEVTTDIPELPVLSAALGGRGLERTSPLEYVLEDFNDIVTENDMGFNDFQGNTGALNSEEGVEFVTLTLSPDSQDAPGGSLSVALDFTLTSDQEAFTGWFNSLFGLTDTLTTFDGTTVETLDFPHLALNLTDMFGEHLGEPDRDIDAIKLFLKNVGGTALTIKYELTDSDGTTLFTRRDLLETSTEWEELTLAVPGDFPGDAEFDYTHVKQFNLVLERNNFGDDVHNPDLGSFLIDNVRLLDNDDTWLDASTLTDDEVLDLVERRAFQYFLDWSSGFSESIGLVQDRGTFGDLLTAGATNLSIYPIGAERGWMTREEAATRVNDILAVFNGENTNDEVMGPEAVGMIGYRGFFYHFLGVNGRRKLNFDFPETKEVDESLNTVEVSTIDTALFLCGAITAASYFDSEEEPEPELRQRVNEIWSAVDWPFMLETKMNQFYLGWKPLEERSDEPPFEILDEEKLGHYSGEVGFPGTLDFYTDEAVLVCLLAIASPNPDHRVDESVYFDWVRQKKEVEDGSSIVATFPGALFTYQFAAEWLDTACLGSDLHPMQPLDLFVNSQKAIEASREWSIGQAGEQVTYSLKRWGPTANEDADDFYRAHGAPPVAVADPPEENGTVAPYGAICSAPFILDEAVASMRHYLGETDAWRYRFGWADALHFDIGAPGVLKDVGQLVRDQGEWYNHVGFGIDMAPVLVLVENARTGLVQRLFHSNPHVGNSLGRLYGKADAEPDGDVDLDDYSGFQDCVGQPGAGYKDPDCLVYDMDCDGDVDLSDFGLFQGLFGGSP